MLVEGELTVGRTLHRPGSIRVVRAGTGYGPIQVGPNGARTIDTFASGRNMTATWVGSDDRTEAFAAEYRRTIMEADRHEDRPAGPPT